MRNNSCLQAALDELDDAGIRDVERSYGGKHQQLRWRVNGHGMQRMYALPNTPSDYRAAANCRADIRRMLREDGLLVDAPPKPLPPPKSDRISKLEARVAALESALRTISLPATPAPGAPVNRRP
jgi:hypothetical protein